MQSPLCELPVEIWNLILRDIPLSQMMAYGSCCKLFYFLSRHTFYKAKMLTLSANDIQPDELALYSKQFSFLCWLDSLNFRRTPTDLITAIVVGAPCEFLEYIRKNCPGLPRIKVISDNKQIRLYYQALMIAIRTHNFDGIDWLLRQGIRVSHHHLTEAIQGGSYRIFTGLLNYCAPQRSHILVASKYLNLPVLIYLASIFKISSELAFEIFTTAVSQYSFEVAEWALTYCVAGTQRKTPLSPFIPTVQQLLPFLTKGYLIKYLILEHWAKHDQRELVTTVFQYPSLIVELQQGSMHWYNTGLLVNLYQLGHQMWHDLWFNAVIMNDSVLFQLWLTTGTIITHSLLYSLLAYDSDQIVQRLHRSGYIFPTSVLQEMITQNKATKSIHYLHSQGYTTVSQMMMVN